MPNSPAAISGAIIVVSVAVAVSHLPASCPLSANDHRPLLPSTNPLMLDNSQKMSGDALRSLSIP
jgi:hypothetical protein